MSSKDIRIYFTPAGSIDHCDLTYVVIGAREEAKWIFVRHRDRDSWELPAGHIEPGESADEAARRELFEETGTTEALLYPLTDYTVVINGEARHGKIYFAEIQKRGKLPELEIAEIKLSASSPRKTTYPEAHIKFVALLEEYIRSQ